MVNNYSIQNPLTFLAYCVVIIIGLNNTLISQTVVGITIDRLLEMAIFLLLLPIVVRDALRDRNLLIFAILVLFLVALKSFVLLNESAIAYMSLDTVLRDIVRILVFFVIFYLFYFCLKFLGLRAIDVLLIVTAPFFLLAFIQHPVTPFTDIGIEITQNLFSGNFIQDTTNKGGYVYADLLKQGFMIRPTGPYGSPIILSYQLIPIMGLTLYMYLVKKNLLYYFWFLFLFLVSFLTLTRSLIMAASVIFLSICFLQMYLKRDRWIILFLFSLSIPVSILVIGQLEFFGRIFSFGDFLVEGDMSERQIAWLSGLLGLFENPLSFNSSDFSENFKSLCTQSTNCQNYISMHNGFLRVGRDFTLIGLCLYLFLLIWIFIKSNSLNLHLKILFSSLFFAFLVHTFFHNNTLFISEYMILLPIVLLFNIDKEGNLNAL